MTTAPKYQPAPYSVSDEVENHGTHWEVRVNNAMGGQVCRVWSHGGPDPKGQMYATAELLAAAPELLAALEGVVEACTPIPDKESDYVARYAIKAVREAIAKAKGA